jgi:hypothetical protein
MAWIELAILSWWMQYAQPVKLGPSLLVSEKPLHPACWCQSNGLGTSADFSLIYVKLVSRGRTKLFYFVDRAG